MTNNPDSLLLVSGGIDSAYCMWRALSEGRRLHVHHVHLTNHEGRVQYEARAVERILKWMRGRGLTSFRYTESAFDYGSIRYIVKDHNVWALWIGILLSDPRNRNIKRVIRPDHYDSLPGGPDSAGMQVAHRRYRNISYEVCGREIEWEHPIQHMTKAEVIHVMPRDLLELCWYCRRPTHSGKPCHRCYTCRLVDAALKGGPLMYEAKVIHPFRDKHTKVQYEPGDTYRHKSKERMEYLAGLSTPRVEWPPNNGTADVGNGEGETLGTEPTRESELEPDPNIESDPEPELAPDSETEAVTEANVDPDPESEPNLEGTPELKHVGGGHYELPDGRRIRGKEAALAALRGNDS